MTIKKTFQQVLILIFVCTSAVITKSYAATGDELIVTSEIVNMRSEASTNGEILMRFAKSRELIEINREGDWVEVYTKRDDTQRGWIYKTLLKPVQQKKPRQTLDEKRSQAFQAKFAEYAEAIQTQNGTQYFSEAQEKEDYTIEVIATAAWLESEIEQRQTTVSKVFKLWSDVVPVGSSMSVIVLDEAGEQHMVMLR